MTVFTDQVEIDGSGQMAADADAVPFPVFPVPCPCSPPTTDCTDPTTFRQHFPEFDYTVYPDYLVQTYLDLGGIMVSPWRWKRMRQRGIELVAAHMLALHQFALLSACGGAGGLGIPGLARGIMTTKSVSKVSVGYDASHFMQEGAGPWNYTVYGQEFYWLMKMVGTGGVEMLSFGYGESMSGIVWTWARGVMLSWGS